MIFNRPVGQKEVIMSRFKNKATTGGGGTMFIKSTDLCRAEFEGVIAEGEFVGALPNKFDDSKNDFKIKIDTKLKVSGKTKDGEPYNLELAPGDTVVVNGAGNLNYLMKNVAPGEICQISYNGMKEIEAGKRAGTLAHNFEVEYGAE